MMIGNKELTITHPSTYLYSGKGGTNKVPNFQPPAKGGYLQFQLGAGYTGSIIVYGTADGVASATETISAFDSDGIGFSYKLWTLITKMDITILENSVDVSPFIVVKVYPANSSGDIVESSSTTTSTIICDYYSVNLNQFRGIYPEVTGDRFKSFKQIEYDGRFSLQVEDKVTIGDKEYIIFNIDNPETDFYVAFAGASR
jgi:hypothetical protein